MNPLIRKCNGSNGRLIASKNSLTISLKRLMMQSSNNNNNENNMIQDIDDEEIQTQVPSISFEGLSVGDRVYDFDDGCIGVITTIINEEHEPEWKRIEVEWEREHDVVDKSFILSDTMIGVEITPDHPFFSTMEEALGDTLCEIQEEYGDELVMLALAKW
jgi:hypothetical protein